MYTVLISWFLICSRVHFSSTPFPRLVKVELNAPLLASFIILLTVGIAINAIIPKISITAYNSINVNPFFN